MGLTDRQAEILTYIVRHWQEKLSSPSMREIGDAFGIVSPNGVECHLRALESKGSIHRRGDVARSITVVGMSISMPSWAIELLSRKDQPGAAHL